MNLPIFLLLGGYGTRLKTLTRQKPKSLIEINEKPFLYWQLKFFKEQGGTDIVLCIGHMGDQIRRFAGDGSRFGLNITYSEDGPTPLGTGGALKKAIAETKTQAFFVFYGDSYLPINLESMEGYYSKHSKIKNLMAVYKNKGHFDKSNVVFQDGSLRLYDKINSTDGMSYIDYGVSILDKSSLKLVLFDSKFELSDLYHTLSLNNQIAGYEVFERFFEIGSLKGIQETAQYLGAS